MKKEYREDIICDFIGIDGKEHRIIFKDITDDKPFVLNKLKSMNPTEDSFESIKSSIADSLTERQKGVLDTLSWGYYNYSLDHLEI